MSAGVTILNLDEHSSQRIVTACLYAMLLNALLWQAVAAVALAPRKPQPKFIEISRINIPPDAPKSPALAPAPQEIAPVTHTAEPPLPKVEPKKIIPRKTAKPRVEEERSAPPPPEVSAPPDVASAGLGLEGYNNNYDVPAEALHQVKPEIPANFRRKDFKTYVRVRVDVESGAVAVPSLRTSSGNPEIDNLVLSALRSWTWKPATRNGEPVSSTLYFKFVFEVK